MIRPQSIHTHIQKSCTSGATLPLGVFVHCVCLNRQRLIQGPCYCLAEGLVQFISSWKNSPGFVGPDLRNSSLLYLSLFCKSGLSLSPNFRKLTILYISHETFQLTSGSMKELQVFCFACGTRFKQATSNFFSFVVCVNSGLG